MADQQFCLRWNNHQSTLISVFDTLLENGTLVDCTLAAEGQYLRAHKVVLSACSPYLETLLSQHYEKHPIVILKDVKFSELKSMMDYMYRGEVNISQDQLGTFLKAAESLQIKGLSDNGTDGDARDVGSTTKAPPPPRKSTQPATSARPAETLRSDSPALRDGSISPSSRKRRRVRRNSDEGDSHLDSNSCDLPSQAQSTPVPIIPATSSITTTPIIKPPIVKPEQTETINRIDSNSLPPESGLLKEKIEPMSEPLLEPKTEYLEDVNNEDSVEDLTLDDDDDMEGMDISNMSNMSNMSRPGPSHGNDISNQGFAPWQLGGNQSGTDEVFMAAQEAVNQHRDSQDGDQETRNDIKPGENYIKKEVEEDEIKQKNGVEFSKKIDENVIEIMEDEIKEELIESTEETMSDLQRVEECGMLNSERHKQNTVIIRKENQYADELIIPDPLTDATYFRTPSNLFQTNLSSHCKEVNILENLEPRATIENVKMNIPRGKLALKTSPGQCDKPLTRPAARTFVLHSQTHSVPTSGSKSLNVADVFNEKQLKVKKTALDFHISKYRKILPAPVDGGSTNVCAVQQISSTTEQQTGTNSGVPRFTISPSEISREISSDALTNSSMRLGNSLNIQQSHGGKININTTKNVLSIQPQFAIAQNTPVAHPNSFMNNPNVLITQGQSFPMTQSLFVSSNIISSTQTSTQYLPTSAQTHVAFQGQCHANPQIWVPPKPREILRAQALQSNIVVQTKCQFPDQPRVPRFSY